MALGVGFAISSNSSKAIPVHAANGDSYSLVTDASTLASGDSLLIVSESKGDALSTTQNKNNRGVQAITISNHSTTVVSGVQEIDLGGSTDAWILMAGSIQLSGVSGQNYLKDGSDTWSIAVTSAGVATITSAASSRVIKRNTSSALYGTYASGQTDVQIYKKDAGECTHNWVAGTVHAPTCTEAGYTEYECSLCHETKQDDVTAALGHNFVDHVCTRCGAEEPLNYQIVFTSDVSASDVSTAIDFSVYTIPTGVTFDNPVNFIYGASGKNLKMNKSSGSGSSFDVTIPSTRKVTTIVVKACYWNTDSTAQLKIIPSGGSAIDATSGSLASGTFSDLTFNISSSNVNKFTVSAPTGGKRVFISAMTINYTESTPSSSLSFDKTEIVGYTGDEISITATFANLESDLAWSASGTGSISGGTITWSSDDHRNGTSTFTTTLSGEGGKTIIADATGVEAAQCLVSIVQKIRPVMATVPGEPVTSTLEFTAACGGSGTSDGGQAWVITSDGTESTYDATKGIHYGTSGAAVQYINLTSSDFISGTITKVVVNASTASGVSATVAVNIGGNAFGGEPQSLTTSAAAYTFDGEVSADEIEVIVTKPSSATKAIYCKSVAVTYSTSSTTTDIANKVGHEAAQATVVKFAKAFNTALGATQHCTTGLSEAWSTASSAWTTFTTEAAALGSAEETYAKSLIANATAQWTPDTDSDYEYCLERAMATYEACVSKHGQTPFMSAVRPVESAKAVFNTLIDTNNAIPLVVLLTVISITSITAFLIIRKKKEN